MVASHICPDQDQGLNLQPQVDALDQESWNPKSFSLQAYTLTTKQTGQGPTGTLFLNLAVLVAAQARLMLRDRAQSSGKLAGYLGLSLL